MNQYHLLLDCIKRLKTNETTKKVLSQLIYFNLQKGEAYPSHKTLARLSGKSVRSVQYSLEKLEDFGLISRNKRSYLKTKIYNIHFDQLTELTKKSTQSLKKFAPKIASEIAHKKKINNKLKIAKAMDNNLEDERKGKGTSDTSQQENFVLIDLSLPLDNNLLETIVAEVNDKAQKSFNKSYFIKSIEKIKEIDLQNGKSFIISLRVLIKRLIGWVKRELINSEAASVLRSRSTQQTDQIQPQVDIETDLQEVCNQAQGNHPKRLDIIQTLRLTFERFDRSLSFKSWFKNCSIEEGEGGAALLKWSTSFDRDWVQNNFGTELRYAFTRLGMAYEFGI